MPTGYSYPIEEDENYTFKEYLLSCARSCGALHSMRDKGKDAPLPDSIEPEPYHLEKLEEVKAKLENLKLMTDEQKELAATAQYARALKFATEANESVGVKRARYEAMLTRVIAWVPPTPEHDDLKKFMIEQIQTSFPTYIVDLPKRMTGAEWAEEENKDLLVDVLYHEKKSREQAEWARKATAWVKTLKESVEKL